MSEDIVRRLRTRSEIRRSIQTRKSVQNGEPDRLADLLDEAAAVIERSRRTACPLEHSGCPNAHKINTDQSKTPVK